MIRVAVLCGCLLINACTETDSTSGYEDFVRLADNAALEGQFDWALAYAELAQNIRLEEAGERDPRLECRMGSWFGRAKSLSYTRALAVLGHCLAGPTAEQAFITEFLRVCLALGETNDACDPSRYSLDSDDMSASERRVLAEQQAANHDRAATGRTEPMIEQLSHDYPTHFQFAYQAMNSARSSGDRIAMQIYTERLDAIRIIESDPPVSRSEFLAARTTLASQANQGRANNDLIGAEIRWARRAADANILIARALSGDQAMDHANLRLLGQSLFALSLYNQADGVYQQLLERENPPAAALAESVMIALKRRDVATAEERLSQLTPEYATSAHGHYLRGMIARQKGDTDAAESEFRKAARWAPWSMDYRQQLALLPGSDSNIALPLCSEQYSSNENMEDSTDCLEYEPADGPLPTGNTP